mmetsp:Transcript_11625/g.15340  ORF Transcript_11625/g.15340 Transcript_11625/m.15340 type:complete len:153 (-) Transcript_11625:7-465(-)
MASHCSESSFSTDDFPHSTQTPWSDHATTAAAVLPSFVSTRSHSSSSSHTSNRGIGITSDCNNIQIPHRGSLCRIDSNNAPLDYEYAIKITLELGGVHELRFERIHYEFMSRLFAILDTESRGSVGRTAVMEFVTLRCPVFWRRDDDLRRLG